MCTSTMNISKYGRHAKEKPRARPRVVCYRLCVSNKFSHFRQKRIALTLRGMLIGIKQKKKTIPSVYMNFKSKLGMTANGSKRWKS